MVQINIVLAGWVVLIRVEDAVFLYLSSQMAAVLAVLQYSLRGCQLYGPSYFVYVHVKPSYSLSYMCTLNKVFNIK